MPSTPIRSTVTPVLRLGVGGWPGAVRRAPKASVARSTPIAIVSTSRPSGLKPTSAMPIVGFCSTSGPSVIGLVAGDARPARSADSVKVERRPAQVVDAVAGSPDVKPLIAVEELDVDRAGLEQVGQVLRCPCP